MSEVRARQVRRILERYLVEVVERYELCPWARSSRLAGEHAVEIVWGQPSLAAWLEAGRRVLAVPAAQVGLVVAPELVISLPALRAIRDLVAKATGAGVAEFHPAGKLDLSTPGRLVPYLRRSPDPLLQLVSLDVLTALRRSPALDLAAQARILGGQAQPHRDVAERIAVANHQIATRHHAEIEATLSDIAADRKAAYVQAGIAV